MRRGSGLREEGIREARTEALHLFSQGAKRAQHGMEQGAGEAQVVR